MESEEEREIRLARSSPEQPRPSTSKAVSPPHLDGPSSPEGPTVGSKGFLPNNNHAASDAGEAGREIAGQKGLRHASSPPGVGWEPSSTSSPLPGSPVPVPGVHGAHGDRCTALLASPPPASPVCGALSCHQVGQGKCAVCLGGENGAVHQVTRWDSSARSLRGSVAPSPNTPLQCPALHSHPRRVSPGSVYWTVARAQRDLGGKVHIYHFPNLSAEVTCMKELISPGCLLRTLPDRESSGMSSS